MGRGDELVGGIDYVPRQLVWISLGVAVMAFAALFNYRLLRPFSSLLFFASLISLVLVYWFPAKSGAHRWIPVGPINIQPSEIAKLTYIMALAHYLMHRDNYRRLTGLLVPFILTIIPVGLILREPDLGTSLLFFPVLFSMLFAAGARIRHFVLIMVIGVVLLPALWMGMNSEQRSRITSLTTQVDGGQTPRGDGYHLHQSKQLLALGGIWGSSVTGPALDDPLAYHLPASRTDFIFCLIGERYGLVGCLATLLLYLLLFARALAISHSTDEPFGRLVIVGIVALLATQLVINTGMTVGLMPITGLTLPFLSYGGSSLLMTCFALGLIINVALHPGYEIHGEPFRHGRENESMRVNFSNSVQKSRSFH